MNVEWKILDDFIGSLKAYNMILPYLIKEISILWPP